MLINFKTHVGTGEVFLSVFMPSFQVLAFSDIAELMILLDPWSYGNSTRIEVLREQ